MTLTPPALSAGLSTQGFRGHSAAATVGAYLRAQAQQMLVSEDAVRAKAADGVHDMRVATRRLRSVLKTFAPLFEGDAAGRLRDELKWIAGVLGAARDLEVLRARVDRHIGELPSEQVLGPVRNRLDVRLAAESGEAHRALADALDSDRFRQLVTRLVEFVADPPFSESAFGKRRKTLRPLVRAEHRKLAKRMRASMDATGEQHDIAVHGVRKQAKRARYAAEAVEPVFGKPARRYVKAMASLQELLGERQDAVVSGGLFYDEGRVAGVTPNENGYTFGLLAGREAGSILLCDHALPGAWKKLNKATRRKWLES